MYHIVCMIATYFGFFFMPGISLTGVSESTSEMFVTGVYSESLLNDGGQSQSVPINPTACKAKHGTTQGSIHQCRVSLKRQMRMRLLKQFRRS